MRATFRVSQVPCVGAVTGVQEEQRAEVASEQI